MAKQKINWQEAIKPLLKKYKNKKHPLEYKNLYQFLVMAILSAQSNDKLINSIAPELFKVFPNMKSLSTANEKDLLPYIKKVIGFNKKAVWLIKTAKVVKTDKNIPTTMKELLALPGIGRKTANVIMKEAKVKAEGIAVDLHVVRVAQRMGIALDDDPKKIEKQIMEVLPQKYWGETGMAISFLGREICRPTSPDHQKCTMKEVCVYYNS